MMNQTPFNKEPIAILAAVGMELQPLRHRLKKLRSYATPKPLRLELWQGPRGPVYLGLTGMGPQAAATAMRILIDQFKPSAVFSVGFAGALSEALNVGDLVIAEHCQRLCDPQRLTLEQTAAPSDRCRQRAQSLAQCVQSKERRVMVGTFVSSPTVVCKSQTKRQISQLCSSPAVGVDMETAAILETLHASSCGIPFFSLRAISDTLDQDLDFDFAQFHNFYGKLKPFGALKYFVSHPRAALQLTHLLANSRKAAVSLADCVYRSLEHLDSWSL